MPDDVTLVAKFSKKLQLTSPDEDFIGDDEIYIVIPDESWTETDLKKFAEKLRQIPTDKKVRLWLSRASNLTKIPAHCFEECSALISISLPDNLKEIEEYAFYNCDCLLDDINLPYGVVSIKKCAFKNSGVTRISFLGMYLSLYYTELYPWDSSTMMSLLGKWKLDFNVETQIAVLLKGTYSDYYIKVDCAR